jgi:hypothetical protein
MREPRQHQRMPEGGKRLYELLRMDHEPVLIDVFVIEELPRRERLKQGDTLGFSREFDPMLYFWPVESQHCVVHLWSDEPELIERLGRALLRDGALWVSFLTGGLSYKIHTRGDVNAFWQRRYGTDAPTLGSVATPAGGG